ncbi:hypothetical protein HDU83_007498 [Entophlyctis luteolus]|nr:hypothetical protein HDU83_007498 [Entophlyctis luteolus]
MITVAAFDNVLKQIGAKGDQVAQDKRGKMSHDRIFECIRHVKLNNCFTHGEIRITKDADAQRKYIGRIFKDSEELGSRSEGLLGVGLFAGVSKVQSAAADACINAAI